LNTLLFVSTDPLGTHFYASKPSIFGHAHPRRGANKRYTMSYEIKSSLYNQGDYVSDVTLFEKPLYLAKADRKYTVYDEYGKRLEGESVYISEVVPHAQFSLNKDLHLWTEDDAITSGMYELNIDYWMDIYNENDTNDTVLENLGFTAQSNNITDVDWEEYAEWNESSVEWDFPAYHEFIIDADDGFGTGFSRGIEIRDLNVSVSRWMNKTEFNSSSYQLAKFNVIFDDTNFEWVWARIEANEHHEIEASIVPGTFTCDAPLGCLDE